MHTLRRLIVVSAMFFTLVAPARSQSEAALIEALRAIITTQALEDGPKIVEDALRSRLVEYDRDSVPATPAFLAKELERRKVFGPVDPASPLTRLAVNKASSALRGLTLGFADQACVDLAKLEEALGVKARHLPDVPMHGGPLPPTPSAFLPGTNWTMFVQSAVVSTHPEVDLAVRRGVKIFLTVTRSRRDCLATIHLETGDVVDFGSPSK
jgi:hypothetical protein